MAPAVAKEAVTGRADPDPATNAEVALSATSQTFPIPDARVCIMSGDGAQVDVAVKVGQDSRPVGLGAGAATTTVLPIVNQNGCKPIPANRNYEKGTLAMANSGPNTNGSQFFICVDDLTAKNLLPKQYTIFGKMTEGLDVLDRILAVPRTTGSDGAQSKPTEPVVMQTVSIQVA